MPSYYTSQRLQRSQSSATWAPNRNMTRHKSRVTLGTASRTVIFAALVVIIGLISVSQSARITSYDMAIAEADNELANLQAQRDALAVENAKLAAEAADTETNEAASSMVLATATDYVSN